MFRQPLSRNICIMGKTKGQEHPIWNIVNERKEELRILCILYMRKWEDYVLWKKIGKLDRSIQGLENKGKRKKWDERKIVFVWQSPMNTRYNIYTGYTYLYRQIVKTRLVFRWIGFWRAWTNLPISIWTWMKEHKKCSNYKHIDVHFPW